MGRTYGNRNCLHCTQHNWCFDIEESEACIGVARRSHVSKCIRVLSENKLAKSGRSDTDGMNARQQKVSPLHTT